MVKHILSKCRYLMQYNYFVPIVLFVYPVTFWGKKVKKKQVPKI